MLSKTLQNQLAAKGRTVIVLAAQTLAESLDVLTAKGQRSYFTDSRRNGTAVQL